MLFKSGDIIDTRYRIAELIGDGGMGEVYLASDMINHQQVAIKFLKENITNHEINLTRFHNEAVIACSLKQPNLIKVLFKGEYNNLPYIVSEFIQGQTLKSLVEERGFLSISEACSYLLQVLTALEYAHSHGITHRDIKPENIFILRDGSVKIGDFGIALAEGYYHEKGGSEIIGSLPFLAPEIVKGKEASPQSDIYALGITFFNLITGHYPFYYQDHKKLAYAHVREKFPSPKKYLSSCPEDIEYIIFQATKKNLAQRYQNCSQFYADLLSYYEGKPISKKKTCFFSFIFRK